MDFTRSALLAAVDRKTKSPEVRVPGVQGWRGALSYAVARAFEGQADTNHDGNVTLRELFTNVRQVVYQLSDQRQNMVAQQSANRDLDTEVVFATRGVVPSQPAVAGAPPAVASARLPGLPPVAAQVPSDRAGTDRIARRPEQPVRGTLRRAKRRLKSCRRGRVRTSLWDPTSGDVLVGGDVVAFRIALGDLPSVIDRFAAVRGFKQLAAKSPQAIRVAPNDQLHHKNERVAVEISDVAARTLIAFNIAGDGTVQALYPIGTDAPTGRKCPVWHDVGVKEPFGADQFVAITSRQPMEALGQAIKRLNQLVARADAANSSAILAGGCPVGSAGLFTAP